jgi:hypothetical protein
MNQPAKAAHSVRLYTRVTPALYALLQQVRVARQIEDDAALLREALRRYLDEQAEQVGSKRHFSATFQRRINRLDWHLMVLTYLIAQACGLLIAHATQQKVPGEALIEQAIRLAQEQQATLAQRLDAAQTQIEQEARNRR